MANRNSGPGKAIYLTSAAGTENVDAPVTPSYATPLNGASPTTTSLRIARLTP